MLRNYMDIGIVHFMAYPETMKGEGPILETVKKIAADDYFDAIELTCIKDDNVRKKVKSVVDSAKIQPRYGAQPILLTRGLNPNDIDENGRKKAEATLVEAIDEAQELGCPGIAFLAGKYEEKTKNEAYEQLVKTTTNLCEYAKTKGMNIVLEIFDYDVDKKSLIGPTELAKKFAEDIKVEYDNFGLMIDLSHIPMYRETFEQAIDPIKDHIVHLHVGNAVIDDSGHDGYGDQHIGFGFPNSENDVNELKDFLQHCIDIGLLTRANKKIVSFEVKPFGDEDSDIVIANAKRALNQASAQMKF